MSISKLLEEPVVSRFVRFRGEQGRFYEAESEEKKKGLPPLRKSGMKEAIGGMEWGVGGWVAKEMKGFGCVYARLGLRWVGRT